MLHLISLVQAAPLIPAVVRRGTRLVAIPERAGLAKKDFFLATWVSAWQFESRHKVSG